MALAISAGSPCGGGVIAAHQALQFGEFPDHAGHQIGLGQHGGALGAADIGAYQRRDFAGQLDQPFDPGELGAELGMEHHVFKLGQAMLQRGGQIALVEERRIAQPGADDALIAGRDGGAAIGRHRIGGDDEIGRQLARCHRAGRSISGWRGWWR